MHRNKSINGISSENKKEPALGPIFYTQFCTAVAKCKATAYHLVTGLIAELVSILHCSTFHRQAYDKAFLQIGLGSDCSQPYSTSP